MVRALARVGIVFSVAQNFELPVAGLVGAYQLGTVPALSVVLVVRLYKVGFAIWRNLDVGGFYSQRGGPHVRDNFTSVKLVVNVRARQGRGGQNSGGFGGWLQGSCFCLVCFQFKLHSFFHYPKQANSTAF